MTAVTSVWETIARLLEYPAGSTRVCPREMAGIAAAAGGEAGELLGEFGRAVEGRSLAELEEMYIQTFDLNPDASLDIGWHLFGEDYARGEFLVKLRQQMQRYGVAGRDELPDSLLCVLPLMARMPEDEAAELGTKYVLPAVEKIRKAVPPESNPFAHLLAALALLLESRTLERESR